MLGRLMVKPGENHHLKRWSKTGGSMGGEQPI